MSLARDPAAIVDVSRGVDLVAVPGRDQRVQVGHQAVPPEKALVLRCTIAEIPRESLIAVARAPSQPRRTRDTLLSVQVRAIRLEGRCREQSGAVSHNPTGGQAQANEVSEHCIGRADLVRGRSQFGSSLNARPL